MSAIQIMILAMTPFSFSALCKIISEIMDHKSSRFEINNLKHILKRVE